LKIHIGWILGGVAALALMAGILIGMAWEKAAPTPPTRNPYIKAFEEGRFLKASKEEADPGKK
jgi:hypothetical protein